MAHVSDLLEDGSTTAQTDDGRGGHRYLTAAEIFQLSQSLVADRDDAAEHRAELRREGRLMEEF